MTARTISALFLTCMCFAVLANSRTAACDPKGNLQFVCGPISPEDLVLLPRSPWVIVSSWEDDGYLSVADIRDYSTRVLFPTETSQARHDSATYGSCPGMRTDGFRPHGISLRPGDGDVHTLYVVRHGVRESIEVFQIHAGGSAPTVTWIGCAVAPESLGLNAVVALPDGGFAVTSPRTGDLWEWHAGEEWSRVPGSEDIGPNGLEVSEDGRWYFVAGYGSRSLIRLSRGQTPLRKDAVEVGFHIDNVHWAPDGSILAAGHTSPTPTRVGECISASQCRGIISKVAKVDPQALTFLEIFSRPSDEHLILGTVAIQVGQEIWVGSVGGGDRIARFLAPE